MGVFVVAIYFLAAALVASLGRGRALGFWGFFLLSLIVTPLPVLVLLLLLPSRHPPETSTG